MVGGASGAVQSFRAISVHERVDEGDLGVGTSVAPTRVDCAEHAPLLRGAPLSKVPYLASVGQLCARISQRGHSGMRA